MNLPSVDVSVAIAVFGLVAILQALRQTQRVVKRQPAGGRPRFARRVTPVFLLSCLTLVAPPALTGMLWGRRSASQGAAAADLTRQGPAFDVAPSPSGSVPSGSVLPSEVAGEPSAPAVAAPAPSRPSSSIPASKRAASRRAVRSPARAGEELPAGSTTGSTTDQGGQAESGQAESPPEEAGSQPEGQEGQEGLFGDDGDQGELLNPDLPPLLVGE